jgi:exodeoxyribonuclease VII large subunit
MRAISTLLSARRQQHGALQLRLQAQDPQQVLARGYAWLSDQQGNPVQSVTQVRAGDAVLARLIDGGVNLEVTEVRPDARE